MKYLFLFLVACEAKGPTKMEDVKRELGQAVDTTAQYAKENVQETRDEAVKRTEVKLQAIDQKLTALKADLAKRNDQAKASAQRSLAELEEKRAQLQAELAKMKADSETQWRETQRKVNAVGDAFEASFKDLKSRLDKI